MFRCLFVTIIELFSLLPMSIVVAKAAYAIMVVFILIPVISMITTDAANESRTARTGRGCYLTPIARFHYSDAITMAESMRPRSRGMQKLEHS